jgi:hypothetical protein
MVNAQLGSFLGGVGPKKCHRTDRSVAERGPYAIGRWHRGAPLTGRRAGNRWARLRLVGRAPDPTVTSEPAHLFEIPPSRQPTDAHRSPPQFRHQLRQPPVGARTPRALRDFENIEHPLSGNPLDAVVADLTMQAFQRRALGIATASDDLSLAVLQLL